MRKPTGSMNRSTELVPKMPLLECGVDGWVKAIQWCAGVAAMSTGVPNVLTVDGDDNHPYMLGCLACTTVL